MPKIMPDGYMGNTEAALIFKILSDVAGLWMWGLCFWFFLVSVGAHWQVIWPASPEHKIDFEMTWSVLTALSLCPLVAD